MEASISFPEVVDLNVGGRHFTTSLTTLTGASDSKLAEMFSGRHHVPKDKDGRYFIDVDGDDFAHILKFLRFKKTPPPEKALDILECAEYFGLKDLKTVLYDFMPVRAISLYDEVRKKTKTYDSMLQRLKTDLFEQPIRSGHAFVTFRATNACGKSPHRSEGDYLNIAVHTPCTYDWEVILVAAAMIHDLKGVSPADETIYRPVNCTCTIRRKIRLTV